MLISFPLNSEANNRKLQLPYFSSEEEHLWPLDLLNLPWQFLEQRESPFCVIFSGEPTEGVLAPVNSLEEGVAHKCFPKTTSAPSISTLRGLYQQPWVSS